MRKSSARIKSGALRKAEPAVVVSNRRDLEPLAQAHGLPFVRVPWEDRQKAEQQALRVLDEHEVDFVVLARFMKILSPNFVWRFKNKIINIHPSLLPSFPGPQAYRQAYEQGVKIIGVSSHFVTMNLDEGPIIAQDCFAGAAGHDPEGNRCCRPADRGRHPAQGRETVPQQAAGRLLGSRQGSW